MKQRFFVDTIESSFIKNLLHSTPLPIFNTITDGEYIFEKKAYIYKKQIIKCSKSGYFLHTPEDQIGAVLSEQKIVGQFVFGKDIPQITERFHSKYSYYDTNTHEWLGQYLRCYRDIFNINLMPFYNCYSGRYLSGYKLKDDGIYEDLRSTTYKIYQVPIKFNRTYTIAVDSEYAVHLCPAFIKGGSFVQMNMGGEKFDLTERFLYAAYDSGSGILLTSHHSTSFVKPFTFKVDITDFNSSAMSGVRIQDYEKDLYLLIQVASNNESSLVVLEGDYTKTVDRISMPYMRTYLNKNETTITKDDYTWLNFPSKRFNPDNMDDISDERFNELMLSKLSLLQLNDQVRYPFANRLIEYLLLNVIDSNDEIPENVLRVQNRTALLDNKISVQDVWDNYLRDYVFRCEINDRYTRLLDLNGFVDKDAEKTMGGN